MNYIVFDLEFNQALNPKESNIKCPFEIIQVGALKLDDKFQVVSSFDRFVKPEVYTDLHPFVKQLSGIKDEDLTFANPFKEAYKMFAEFIDNESILCVWGMVDMKALLKNAQYHNLETSIIPKKYINIQKHASKYLHCNRGSNVGLRNAIEMMNIPINKRFHDALSDAYYTAEVFKKIYNESIKIELYQPDKKKKRNNENTKTTLDTEKLIKQFEKMYNRPMTDEEQSIIKLAYLMGKTNQFQSVRQNKESSNNLMKGKDGLSRD